MNTNQRIIATARKYLGVAEFPGKQSNAVVEEFFERAGHPGLTDDVPWCAAFVGAVLAEIGIPPSGSLMARSYMTWGKKVHVNDMVEGDIAVIPRGKPPAGHVFFVLRVENGRVYGLGGNQKDQVSEESWPLSSVIAARRADPSVYSGRATVKEGSRGAMVLDLQDQLRRLRYFNGKIDGNFGPLTRASVLAFQADHGLETDGIVGNRTWEALQTAEPKPLRDVSVADLRRAGSETVKNSDTVQLVAGGSAALQAVSVVREAATEATTTLGIVDPLVRNHWPSLIAIALCLLALLVANHIKKRRAEDARIGANVSR